MALLLGELATKPLDENCLRNRIDVKKHDQSNQTKHNIGHLDLEDGLRAAPHCRETKNDHCKGEEKNDKNRVTPHPPLPLLNFLKFAPQLLISVISRTRNTIRTGVTTVLALGGNSPPLPRSSSVPASRPTL